MQLRWANFWRLFSQAWSETGSIEIEIAGGNKFTLGDGSGPKLGVRFVDKAAAALLLLDPELNFGELWMDGRIEVTQGTIFEVLMLNAANMWRPEGSLWVRLLGKARSALRRLSHPNGLLRARRNLSCRSGVPVRGANAAH